MLKVKNLKKEFRSGDSTVNVISDVSFSIPAGSFSVVLGKSGSGKSTLLSLLGALDKPTSGEIKVDDRDITKLGDNSLIQYRRNEIGFVFQSYNLIPNLSAIENVMLPMEFAGVSSKSRKERAKVLLEEVGITEDKFNRKPTRLSGGEQQRVAIARSLTNKPKLILADEPTGNLDNATGKIIINLLRDLVRKEKTTIIAVTHDQGIARLADETFHIRDGMIVS